MYVGTYVNTQINRTKIKCEINQKVNFQHISESISSAGCTIMASPADFSPKSMHRGGSKVPLTQTPKVTYAHTCVGDTVKGDKQVYGSDPTTEYPMG